ncbi:MAG: efflux RND transporter periplasmic adaptor subunit [Gammaproteobacteria bacterium]
MKFFINIVLSAAVIIAGVYVGQQWLQSSSAAADGKGHDDSATGPHGGRLLKADDIQLEITVFERGVPPEFRVYAYRDDKPIKPEAFAMTMELTRLGGEINSFTFVPRGAYRVSNETVNEPHSFDVRIRASHDGHEHEWSYAQHEGRTIIAADQADAAGIETATAGPATIKQTVELQGRMHYDDGRLRQVRARYAGIVQTAGKAVGDRVARGETLARVESNDSLQTYTISAPTDGVIIAQQAAAGEAITNDQVLYTIANLDRLWVDLAVFRQQMDRIAADQSVQLQSLDGELNTTARIDYLLPMTDSRSQATSARIHLDNSDGRWRPGMAVTATVTVGKTEAPLAVRNSALQTFRDFDVVFARYGDTYEVRMLELGRSDATHTEVLSGIDAGTEYVVGNSYLLKADIEKSAAAHAH